VTDDYRTERLGRGNLDLQQNAETGEWSLSWNPDHGEPDWPGHTYSPGDDDLPDDFPGPDDPDALIAWGRGHFGP
jgi:hypothetical protein